MADSVRAIATRKEQRAALRTLKDAAKRLDDAGRKPGSMNFSHTAPGARRDKMMLRAGTRRSLANAVARVQLPLRRLIAVAEQAIEMASPLVKDWRSRTTKARG